MQDLHGRKCECHTITSCTPSSATATRHHKRPIRDLHTMSFQPLTMAQAEASIRDMNDTQAESCEPPRRIKVCPRCPEFSQRALVSWKATHYISSATCLNPGCDTVLVEFEQVATFAKTGGLRRVKICTSCHPPKPTLTFSWRGPGQSQWGIINFCPQKGPGHPPLSTFLEVAAYQTPAPMPDITLQQTPTDAAADAWDDQQRTSTKRQRHWSDESSSEIDHDTSLPATKKTKTNLPIPSHQTTKHKHNDSDKENFESFEEEYNYYAAKVRRLLGEDPTKRKTYPKSTKSTSAVQPATTPKHTHPQPVKASSSVTQPIRIHFPDDPTPKPTSATPESEMFARFVPNTDYAGQIRKLMSKEKEKAVEAPSITDETPQSSAQEDKKDCGCTTILCMHRAGGRQSVRNISMGGRR